MKHGLLYLFRSIHHYFLSRSRFDIHSPFVYNFYSEVVKDKTDYAEYHATFEKASYRNTLLSNKGCRLLFRLSLHYKPNNILILGTDDKACTSYLSSGYPGSHLINICDNPGLIADSGLFDMVIVSPDHSVNDYRHYFSLIMQHIHNDSVLVFCDIHGSNEMHEVWNEIKKHSSVTITIDLFTLGLVFCKEELTKEDFILRF